LSSSSTLLWLFKETSDRLLSECCSGVVKRRRRLIVYSFTTQKRWKPETAQTDATLSKAQQGLAGSTVPVVIARRYFYFLVTRGTTIRQQGNFGGEERWKKKKAARVTRHNAAQHSGIPGTGFPTIALQYRS